MNNFKKIISLVLAAILAVMVLPMMALAADKGDPDCDGSVSAKDAKLILQVVAGLKAEADLEDKNAADVNGDGQITAKDSKYVLEIVAGLAEKPEEPKPDDKPSGDSEKAQMAAIFNAETAKAAKGTYKWTRSCAITKDIDAGNATDTLNRIIEGIDANADLNSIVGSFIGVGDANGDQSNAGKAAMVAMNLTESDIKDVQVTNEQITLFINDCKNPTGDGKSSFEHVSNDIITKAEVENAIANSGVSLPVTIKSLDTTYFDIKVTAKLDSKGNPESLKITYKLSATMGLKVTALNVTGGGEMETVIEYTDLKY